MEVVHEVCCGLDVHKKSVTASVTCHSNLSQLVTVAAGSIWGPSGLFRPRELGPSQQAA